MTQYSGYVPARYLDLVRNTPGGKGYKRLMHQILSPQRGEEILDVGCGTGDDLIKIARVVGKSGRAVGIDTDLAMIKEAEFRTGAARVHVELRVEDAHRLSCGECTFDAVRFDRVLQHLRDPFTALREAVRVTKDGGRVVAFEPDWATLLVSALEPQSWNPILQGFAGKLQHPWIGRHLSGMFAQAGLQDIEIAPFTGIIRDAADANSVFRIPELIQWAVDGKHISRGQADTAIEALGKQRSFFSSLTSFIVRGEKQGRA